MPIFNSSSSYGTVAKILHWLLALMLIGMLGVGLFIGSLDNDDPLRRELLGRHAMGGGVVLALMLLRLVWRWINPRVAAPRSVGPALQAAGTLVHYGLYLAVVVQALAGVFMVQLRGFPVAVFGYKLPTLIGQPGVLATAEDARTAEFLAGVFNSVHYYAPRVLIVLLAMHIGAALWHHFFIRDDVLRRMWFGRAR